MEKTPTSRNEGRVLYQAVHYWLKYNYGRASKCENKNCIGKSKNYDWAKKKGKKYEFKRNCFMELCHSCHKKYDVTDGLRKRMSEVSKNKAKTHCPSGHEYTRESSYLYKNISGSLSRYCKVCIARRCKQYRAKQQALSVLKEKLTK